MMKYYKYADTEDNYSFVPPGAMIYIETKNGWTIRQLTCGDSTIMASNVKHPRWGLVLPDQEGDYDSFDEVIPISKEEFDQIWNAHLQAREPKWNAVKQVHPVGMDVNGFIEIFYPQGVIVRLGGDALGVADYQACKASTQPQFMYSLHKVTAVVKGYDEINQWVILDSPQVHEQKVSYEFAHGNRDGDS